VIPDRPTRRLPMTKRIGIIYCKKIQDASCIGCSKCYKAINDRTFAFEGMEDVRLVFKMGCGDCPGLVLPKVDLQMMFLESLDEGVDAIYFGTCVKKATALMNCPMNIEGISRKIEEKFGIPVSVGTHDY
jgi:predicted metal-binding protein